jgi:hypothetical protein
MKLWEEADEVGDGWFNFAAIWMYVLRLQEE